MAPPRTKRRVSLELGVRLRNSPVGDYLEEGWETQFISPHLRASKRDRRIATALVLPYGWLTYEQLGGGFTVTIVVPTNEYKQPLVKEEVEKVRQAISAIPEITFRLRVLAPERALDWLRGQGLTIAA